MNMNEALSAAVDGEKVRAVNMAPGTYIDYHFNGWRINLPGGASSGWHSTEHDNCEWEFYVKPEPAGWDMSAVKPVVAPEPTRRGRKPRSTFVPPAVIDDIGWQPPLADLAKVPQTTWQTEAPKPFAGWPQMQPPENAGLTAEEKPASGWAIFGEGTEK